MGEESTNGPGQPLSQKIKVSSPIAVRRVVLVGDGGELRTFAGSGQRTVEFTHEVPTLAAGKHWFYWRVETEGPNTEYPGNLSLAEGNLGWSTPNWVDQQ